PDSGSCRMTRTPKWRAGHTALKMGLPSPVRVPSANFALSHAVRHSPGGFARATARAHTAAQNASAAAYSCGSVKKSRYKCATMIGPPSAGHARLAGNDFEIDANTALERLARERLRDRGGNAAARCGPPHELPL